MSLLEKKRMARCLDRFEEALLKSLKRRDEHTKLHEAIQYALLGGGKRIRPLLVLLIGEALEKGFDVMPAALCVEYFHTASLIADDMPSMDNDAIRRDRPALHIAFGEDIALLGSYGLIAWAYEMIHENASVMSKHSDKAYEACFIALECASRCSGMSGATLGQFLDLHPPECDVKTLEDIIYKKTVTLFEGSFVMGWVFGGGDFSLLSDVKKLAYHFGMAFQIADDVKDLAQDMERGSLMNMAILLGKDGAKERFFEEIERFDELVMRLDLSTAAFSNIKDWLVRYFLD